MSWAIVSILGITTAVTAGTALYSAEQSKIEGKKARSAAEAAAAASRKAGLGNLTGAEAAASASKRAFRQGLYFTSPTGALKTGTRGRTRLMGA